jgi:putative ABC transport system ATP-binding protein
VRRQTRDQDGSNLVNALARGGTESDYAVQCRGVTRAYGVGDARALALRGIDLEVLRGELLMLMGPSGCGKTTLLSVIAGILDVTAGEIRVLGRDVHAMTSREKTEFRRENVGFVFQQYNLLPTLSTAENVAVPLLIRGMKRKEAVEIAEKELVEVGLDDKLHSYPRNLSGGQQQRVAIARALVAHPRLLVCDEPTANLDGETGGRVMEMLKRVAVARDRCVLVVTHDSRVFRHGDRIAEMLDGRILGVKSGDALHGKEGAHA